MLDALQNHLYPQFKGKTPFKSQSEAKDIMSRVSDVRSKRMGAKRAKADRIKNRPRMDNAAKYERFNTRIQSAERFLTKMYFNLGKTEETFKGRKRTEYEQQVRETEIEIKSQKKYMVDIEPEDAKLSSRWKNKHHMAYSDMPDKEAEMQKGREAAKKTEEKVIELQGEAEEEAYDKMYEDLMAGRTIERRGSF